MNLEKRTSDSKIFADRYGLDMDECLQSVELEHYNLVLYTDGVMNLILLERSGVEKLIYRDEDLNGFYARLETILVPLKAVTAEVLEWAIFYHHLPIVNYLLTNGLSVEEDEILQNPIDLAIEEGDYEIAHCLVDHHFPFTSEVLTSAMKGLDFGLFQKMYDQCNWNEKSKDCLITEAVYCDNLQAHNWLVNERGCKASDKNFGRWD